ncbi:MAG: pantetheine-phosphate adenylyltransferase [Candidatus Nanohaloarchaea archaeon]|nr:pantetheine-phosphate adenylyltransferase [Candidatus Nanohaloarchaea archaeon]
MPFYTPGEEDRKRLKEPRGEVVQGEELVERIDSLEPSSLVTVGDRVTEHLAEAGHEPGICIVDGREQRKPLEEEVDCGSELVLEAENPAGAVTREAWRAVRKAFAYTCRTRVQVDGEEDLLALPAIASAPAKEEREEGSLVVYGQRNEGAVILRAGEELKGFVDRLTGYRTHGHVIVGGTWDVFHAGHRYLLLTALERGRRVDIGVTSDRMARERSSHQVQGFEERRGNVQDFLEEFGAAGRTEIREIDDFRGNALEAGDALAVTPETRQGAERINRERREEGRGELEVIEVDLLEGEAGKISSSAVRNREMDRNGFATD